MYKKKLYRTQGMLPLQGGYAQQVMPGLTRYHGNLHSSGGIMRDSQSEVEDGETEMMVNTPDGNSTPYIFSTYINMDGTKNYDPNKKTVADASVEIAQSGGSQEDINALARFQEKAAGRSGAKVAKRGGCLPRNKKWLGGVVKYQETGTVDNTGMASPVQDQISISNQSEYDGVLTAEPVMPSVNNIYGENLPGQMKWQLMLDYMDLADKSDDELYIMSQGAGSTGFTVVTDEMGQQSMVRSNVAALDLLRAQREEGIRLSTTFPEFNIGGDYNEDMVNTMTILPTVHHDPVRAPWSARESKLSKKIHLALDVAGATEPFGFVADLVNSAYYGIQGLSKFNVKTVFDKELRENIGLGGTKFKELMGWSAASLAFATPIIGTYGTGAKWVGKGADAVMDMRKMIDKNNDKIKLLKTKLNGVDAGSKLGIQLTEQIADIEKANGHLNKLHYGGKVITKSEWKNLSKTYKGGEQMKLFDDDLFKVGDDAAEVGADATKGAKGADEIPASPVVNVADDVPPVDPSGGGRFKWFTDKFKSLKYANPKNWTKAGVKKGGKWTAKQAMWWLVAAYGIKYGVKLYNHYSGKDEELMQDIIDTLESKGFEEGETIEGAEDFANSEILKEAKERNAARMFYQQKQKEDPTAFLDRDGKQMTWDQYADSMYTVNENIKWNQLLEEWNQGNFIHDMPEPSPIQKNYQTTGFVDTKDASKTYAKNWNVTNRQALRLLNQMGYNPTDTIMSSSLTGPGGDSALRTDNEFQVYNYMTELYPEIIGSDGTYNMDLLNQKMKEHDYKDEFGNVKNYERFNIGNRKLHLAKLIKKAGGKVPPIKYQATGYVHRYDPSKWSSFRDVMGGLGYEFYGDPQDPGTPGVKKSQPEVGNTGTFGENYWSTDSGMEGFYTANQGVLNEMGIMNADDFDPSNPDHTGMFQHKYTMALSSLWNDHKEEFEAAGLTEEDIMNFGFEGEFATQTEDGQVISRTYTPYDDKKVNQLDAEFGGYTGGSQGWFMPVVENNNEEVVLDPISCPPCNGVIPERDANGNCPPCNEGDPNDGDVPDDTQNNPPPTCPCDPSIPADSPDCICNQNENIHYNKPRNLSWMLPVIGGLAQFPAVIKGLQDKPHYVTPMIRPGQKLNYADYNNQIIANRRDMNTVNQFIENTAAGPAKIAMMMANQNRSREKESSIRAEERNVNRQIQNLETQANVEISNQNARDILEAERLNRAEDRTVFENKVAAWEQFGKNMGTFTGDAMKFLTDQRIADAIAGETGINDANRFFRANPDFVVNGQITEEGQKAYEHHQQQRRNRWNWLLGNRQQQYGTYS